MTERPSSEEVHQEVLNLLKDWGKDFDQDRDNLIMAPTGQVSKFKIVVDENPITFDAIWDAINIVNACLLKYEVEVEEYEEGNQISWVVFTLIYPPSTHLQDFLTASKSYVGLDNYWSKIEKTLQNALEGVVDKYSLGDIPVLVELELDSTPKQETTGEDTLIEKYEIWENLRFRSETEIRIAQALNKIKGVLFFPNAKARLGHHRGRVNREPDFLVCYKGRWGILEVDGSSYHQNAANDHTRDRLFKLHGITIVEHFDATDCYENPEHVVQQFLYLLSQGR